MIQDEAGRQLQYNAWNRLVRVSLSGDQVAAYQYNGLQQRIVTTVGNGPSAIARDLFYSAGWQVLEQRIRTGSSLGSVAEEQFVWSVAYIDGLILRDRNADLNNATGAGGLEERVYALQDALWNTTALVDVNGNVLDRFAYSPYGVVETLNSNWAPTGSPSIPWAVLFRGYFADEGTGLLHARNRQYSPTLGRFVKRDPLNYVDGYGLYAAYFAPNGVDPYGTVTYTLISRDSYGSTSPGFSAPTCSGCVLQAGSASPIATAYPKGTYRVRGSDGNEYSATCTRDAAGLAATQAHENGHAAGARAAATAGNTNQSLPKTYATPADCIAALPAVLIAWWNVVKPLWNIEVTHGPGALSGQPTAATFAAENAASRCTFTLVRPVGP
jgi:RHS repeat-associated protein